MAYVKGTQYDDVKFDTSGDDVIELFRGIDTVTVTGGHDTADGGEGYGDKLIIDYSWATLAIDMSTLIYDNNVYNPGYSGTIAADSANSVTFSHFEYFDVSSGSGNDNLFGHNLSGGAGNDILYGSGNLYGGTGNDLLIVYWSPFVVDGGDGGDTVSYVKAGSVSVGDEYETGHLIDLNDTTIFIGIENVIGSISSDTIYGDAGNNHLAGMDGWDSIYGGPGNDTLLGGDGVDLLGGGPGDDIIDGGSSWDRVDLSSAANSVKVNLQNGVATGEGTDTLISIEGAVGSPFNDIIIGDSGGNILDGGGGDDVLKGGAGDDDYYVSSVYDRVYETADNGHDRAFTTVSYVLPANVEDVYLEFGSGAVRGRGNASDNTIGGNEQNNYLLGMDGADLLLGREGNDRLDGGAGVDRMYGGGGNDVYYVDTPGDLVVESIYSGSDTVYSSISLTLTAYVERLVLTGTGDLNGSGNAEANMLSGTSGSNILQGFGSSDTLYGLGGNDRLHGGDGTDKVIGGDGDDRLYGGNGNDTLIGGAGNDWIEGGVDRDYMTGSDGADQFVFRNGDFNGRTTTTADIIRDFDRSEGDVIRLNYADANTTVAGDQNFTFIGTAAFHNVAGELRFEQINGNTYVTGDRNGDGVADLMIRLDGVHGLVAGDFVL